VINNVNIIQYIVPCDASIEQENCSCYCCVCRLTKIGIQCCKQKDIDNSLAERDVLARKNYIGKYFTNKTQLLGFLLNLSTNNHG